MREVGSKELIAGLYSIGFAFVWKKQQDCNLSEISKLVRYACTHGTTECGSKIA
jgi:hypothetical protein